MKATEKLPLPSSLDQDQSQGLTQALFPLESLQHLDEQSALRCQKILGHGDEYGVWETVEEMIPHLNLSYRRIDFRRRIAAYLPKKTPSSPSLEALMDEGTLWLTRIALLMRMGPAGVGRRAKAKPLDATSICGNLFSSLANIVARGITLRLANPGNSSKGFASVLTTEDLRLWWADDYLRPELTRLTQLQGYGLWSDAPIQLDFKGKTTAVRGTPRPRVTKRIEIPFPAIPDDYLAAMGPRVL